MARNRQRSAQKQNLQSDGDVSWFECKGKRGTKPTNIVVTDREQASEDQLVCRNCAALINKGKTEKRSKEQQKSRLALGGLVALEVKDRITIATHDHIECKVNLIDIDGEQT